MSDQDGIAKRGRSLEDEYFWKKDRELIEKLRQAADAEQARKDLGRMDGSTTRSSFRSSRLWDSRPIPSACCRSCQSFRWRGPKGASQNRSAS